MDKQQVIDFFDKFAPQWDENAVINTNEINRILDNSGIREGMKVLDVACGTGVMIPFYIERAVSRITAIDISPEMVKIASEKYRKQPKVTVVCGDVEEYGFTERFDSIMVHNAFPHFPDPERLIFRLSGLLNPGGRLTVAHSMSREAINAHHKGAAEHVSNGLMSAEELAEIFKKYFNVDTVISDDRMYQVSGILKK